MKKKNLLLMTVLAAGLLFTACGGESKAQEETTTASVNAETENATEAETEETVKEEEPKTDELTEAELMAALEEQPLIITKTDYIVQSDELKTLYPDMLQAVLQNNSGKDIKSAVVAFAAWDENNLPVKIEGQFDFSGGDYIVKANYEDINLAVDGTFGEESGLSLSENCKVASLKAIAVSYETFEGESWENPYFDAFCSLYEGKKLNQENAQ